MKQVCVVGGPQTARRFRLAGAGAWVLALVLSTSLLSGQPPTRSYDLVIRNARVLDGAGNPWVRADVAIRDGRFAKIGHVPLTGTREIDASGLYLSPGWIDMMDQSGAVLLRNGLAENKLRMGVTTAIGGEGGTPPADGARDPEDGAADVGDFFAKLETQGISINFGSYFSATQARIAVLGTENRPPEPAELETMRAIVRQAMEAGALGLTTALIYPPSSYSTTEELIELAKAAGELGGIYASHIRGEGKELVTAVGEAIEVGEKAGVAVEIFHFKAAFEPGWGTLIRQAIDEIAAARDRGVDVAADVYPYTAGGTGLEATIPSWAHDGGGQALLERLRDPAIRERMKQEVVSGSPGWWNIVEAAGGWENIVLVNARNPVNARWHNHSVAEIAKQLEKHPADVAWDLVAQGEGRVMAIFHMMSEDDIATALRQPWVSIGSDAGASLGAGGADFLGLPHPRAYGTHPRVLAHFVRELGVLSLEQAIQRMTSWPASRMGLADRGLIREGLWADAVLFDPEEIRDLATYEEPQRFPVGVHHVLVNGVVTVDENGHTGARAGRVLYGPGRD